MTIDNRPCLASSLPLALLRSSMTRREIDWNDMFVHLNGEPPDQYMQPTVYYTSARSDLDTRYRWASRCLGEPKVLKQREIVVATTADTRLDVIMIANQKQI